MMMMMMKFEVPGRLLHTIQFRSEVSGSRQLRSANRQHLTVWKS